MSERRDWWVRGRDGAGNWVWVARTMAEVLGLSAAEEAEVERRVRAAGAQRTATSGDPIANGGSTRYTPGTGTAT